MPQPTNANNGQPGGSSDPPKAGTSGFDAGGTPENPQNQDPPKGTGTSEDPPAGSQDPEVPEAYRGENGALDAAKALARLKEIDESAATRREMFGDVPEGDYTFGEIELEGGEKVSIDTENPFLKEALGMFKQAGIGQKGAEQFAGIYAKALAGDIPKIIESYVQSQQQQIQSEIESLGENRKARIDAAMSRVDELLSTQEKPVKGAGRALLQDIRTRANFEALENLLDRLDKKGRDPGSQVVADSDDDVVAIYGSRGSKKQGAG